jgi:hypothetical protein
MTDGERGFRIALLRIDKQYHEACLEIAFANALLSTHADGARGIAHQAALEAIQEELRTLGASESTDKDGAEMPPGNNVA